VGDATDQDRDLVFAGELLVEAAGAADPAEHVDLLVARGHQREVGAGVGDLLQDVVEGLAGLGDRRRGIGRQREDQALPTFGGSKPRGSSSGIAVGIAVEIGVGLGAIAGSGSVSCGPASTPAAGACRSHAASHSARAAAEGNIWARAWARAAAWSAP
jgi:hypothetical protein